MGTAHAIWKIRICVVCAPGMVLRGAREATNLSMNINLNIHEDEFPKQEFEQCMHTSTTQEVIHKTTHQAGKSYIEPHTLQ